METAIRYLKSCTNDLLSQVALLRAGCCTGDLQGSCQPYLCLLFRVSEAAGSAATRCGGAQGNTTPLQKRSPNTAGHNVTGAASAPLPAQEPASPTAPQPAGSRAGERGAGILTAMCHMATRAGDWSVLLQELLPHRMATQSVCTPAPWSHRHEPEDGSTHNAPPHSSGSPAPRPPLQAYRVQAHTELLTKPSRCQHRHHCKAIPPHSSVHGKRTSPHIITSLWLKLEA